VRKPAAEGLTTVTFKTAAETLLGTPSRPATWTEIVPPALSRSPLFPGPLHCVFAPDSVE